MNSAKTVRLAKAQAAVSDIHGAMEEVERMIYAGNRAAPDALDKLDRRLEEADRELTAFEKLMDAEPVEFSSAPDVIKFNINIRNKEN